MKLIDLSQPLYDGAPNCPAHPAPRSLQVADHPTDGWRMEVITMASHTGSHVDAPLHKIAGGASISEMPLESFVGPARIADLRPLAPRSSIGPAELDRTLADLQPGEIALLCTGWGEIRDRTDTWLYDSPSLSPEGARWLVDRGARAVGIDHYSIGGSREPVNSDTHTILLGSGLWVVEELLFPPDALAAPRPSTFLCLPIHLRFHSGSFCRPVLMLG
ncbi:MAG: cyclase family protein [Isosphaeraceae bacterium]|nr:cyclase family protein [Isosphaeraceae bacterium]